jgi:cell division septum initiation protein DivIVA
MTPLEWGLQLLLLALLLGALPFVLRLERRLAELKREGAALETGAAGISEAVRAAQTVLARLRPAAEDAGATLAERIAAAGPLRDDLGYLTERAEALADRLEALVRAARPLAAAAPSDTAPASPRSRAERELLRALEGGRR